MSLDLLIFETGEDLGLEVDAENPQLPGVPRDLEAWGRCFADVS